MQPSLTSYRHHAHIVSTGGGQNWRNQGLFVMRRGNAEITDENPWFVDQHGHVKKLTVALINSNLAKKIILELIVRKSCY